MILIYNDLKLIEKNNRKDFKTNLFKTGMFSFNNNNNKIKTGIFNFNKVALTENEKKIIQSQFSEFMNNIMNKIKINFRKFIQS